MCSGGGWYVESFGRRARGRLVRESSGDVDPVRGLVDGEGSTRSLVEEEGDGVVVVHFLDVVLSPLGLYVALIRWIVVLQLALPVELIVESRWLILWAAVGQNPAVAV